MLQLFLLLSLGKDIFSTISVYGNIELLESGGLGNEGLGNEGLGNEWQTFLKKHEKNYDEHESRYRFEIFKQNYAKINAHNKLYNNGKASYEMEVNQFTDMTFEEIRILYLGFDSKQAEEQTKLFYNQHVYDNVDLPSEVDWRSQNVVTPVKDQGMCGSCYAFSATGSMEGQYALKHKKLISLSEQNIVDCSHAYGNNGCNGGLMSNCYNYVTNNHGIDTEEMYPYEATQGKCRYKENHFELLYYVNIQAGNESALQNAVASVGPVSVAIDAENDFLAYSKGVFTSSTCTTNRLDHGVLVVGYGVENGKDYWLVKNSWGTKWGLSGYIKMARNHNNMCGIVSLASYPHL